jgi:hypothetical protein
LADAAATDGGLCGCFQSLTMIKQGSDGIVESAGTGVTETFMVPLHNQFQERVRDHNASWSKLGISKVTDKLRVVGKQS